MELCNLFEIVVHHLVIGGMTSLDHWVEVLMVSALVCMVTYWKDLW